jgi:hypothetical protein
MSRETRASHPKTKEDKSQIMLETRLTHAEQVVLFILIKKCLAPNQFFVLSHTTREQPSNAVEARISNRFNK